MCIVKDFVCKGSENSIYNFCGEVFLIAGTSIVIILLILNRPLVRLVNLKSELHFDIFIVNLDFNVISLTHNTYKSYSLLLFLLLLSSFLILFLKFYNTFTVHNCDEFINIFIILSVRTDLVADCRLKYYIILHLNINITII